MSSEDFECKICGGCAESRPDGEVEIIETSAKENEGDSGKGSYEREVSEKETEEDSDYGQLSQETWTFMHHIYDGGPVLFYEREKDNEEEKQDLQDEEEDIQQE